jgi:hypothetical protein
MVRDALAFGEGGLGGANLHEAIDGDGIAADDFAVELLGEAQGQGSFSAGGRAGHHEQRILVLSAARH